MKYLTWNFFALLISNWLLASCVANTHTLVTAVPQHTQTSFPEEADTDLPDGDTVWIDPILPSGLIQNFHLPDSFLLVPEKNDAYWTVVLDASAVKGYWVYALVAPFPTITDSVDSKEFIHLWQTGSMDSIAIASMAMSQETKTVISSILGPPVEGLVNAVDPNDLLDLSWSTPGVWAIVPFEELQPKWKVISIDSDSPIQDSFVPEEYLLSAPVSITTEYQNGEVYSSLLSSLAGALPTNYDQAKLTSLIMTGVTAIVRGTAATMEYQGMTYPAAVIGELLRGADITHVSNEIAFSTSCPQPHFQGDVLIFCSQPEYLELLQFIGTDVVEMTGDHFIDTTDEDMLFTLALYDQEGWSYYGGGRNIEEGKAPLYIDHNENKIAFIGCNAKEIGYATASETRPGAVHCDWNYLTSAIPLIAQDGYAPIMTFSHLEYYQYQAIPQLIEDFHRAAEAGAVIVSGSQGHQPQAIEFYNDSFLHYGLGNLFFDQYKEGIPQRQSFIDRHVFYNGRHISTELITIIFVDLAQSRFMTEQERTELLQTVFRASGWTNINP